MSKIPRLFELMEKQGIKEYSLAKATGISPGNIGDWKRGRSAPTIDKLIIVADYLNCSVDYLLGRTDNPEMYATITTGNIIGDNNANINIDSQDEKIMAEFYKIISRMDFREQNNLMNVIYDYIDSKTKE